MTARKKKTEPDVFVGGEPGSASPDDKSGVAFDPREDPNVKIRRTGSAKPTPGSGDENDTSGFASVDKPSKKQDSGQRGKVEDDKRIEQQRELYEKAAKASVEGGVTPPVHVDVHDRIDFIGQEYRDNTGDEDYDPDKPFGGFVFDSHHAADRVDHVAVATNSSEMVLVINGHYFSFGPQLAGALGRLVDNGRTNLNL